MLKLGKKGNIGGNVLEKAIVGIILLAILFQVYAILMPVATQSGDDLNASGVPFGSFFASGGIVWLVIMASLLILVITAFKLKTGGK